MRAPPTWGQRACGFCVCSPSSWPGSPEDVVGICLLRSKCQMWCILYHLTFPVSVRIDVISTLPMRKLGLRKVGPLAQGTEEVVGDRSLPRSCPSSACAQPVLRPFVQVLQGSFCSHLWACPPAMDPADPYVPSLPLHPNLI